LRPIGYLILFVWTLGILTACESNQIYNSSVPIKDAKWAAGDKIANTFMVDDTLSAYNFFINLRNTTNYQYSNIYIFVHTQFPNGRRSVDTVECVLTDPAGRWLGSGNGFIKDNSVVSNKILYQYQKKFPLKGEYRIDLEQAMRQDTLPEIMDVGLRIEKVEK
jgi:gliding motility-associated lipoprotein GldH